MFWCKFGAQIRNEKASVRFVLNYLKSNTVCCNLRLIHTTVVAINVQHFTKDNLLLLISLCACMNWFLTHLIIPLNKSSLFCQRISVISQTNSVTCCTTESIMKVDLSLCCLPVWFDLSPHAPAYHVSLNQHLLTINFFSNGVCVRYSLSRNGHKRWSVWRSKKFGVNRH